MYFFEVVPLQMGVDLRCADVCMPEELLDFTQASATGEQMGGKAVAQGVGRDGLPDSGVHCMALQQTAHCLPAQGVAVYGQEDPGLPG